jgi:hypothetical protein
MQIEISPHDNTYTVTETGSVNQITCTAALQPYDVMLFKCLTQPTSWASDYYEVIYI